MARGMEDLQGNQGSQEYLDPRANEGLRARRASATRPPATRPTGRTATAKDQTSECPHLSAQNPDRHYQGGALVYTALLKSSLWYTQHTAVTLRTASKPPLL